MRHFNATDLKIIKLGMLRVAYLQPTRIISALRLIAKLIVLLFSAHHACGIQVRLDGTSPKRIIVNKTLDGEVKMIASDSRVRRLVPYMSYYHHLSDYNLHPEFHSQVSRANSE